jgi:putative transposase
MRNTEVSSHQGVAQRSGARAPVRVDNTLMTPSFTRTLRFKVRPETYGWLSAAAIEVNQVFNFCNESSLLAATRTDLKRKWLTGFDLCHLTSGSARYFERIGADTIQRICVEYAQKRSAAKRRRLRWRVSRGARRSLGWVPFKAASLKRKGRTVRFCGKTFRIFEAERLNDVNWGQGCFAQDAVGDWWLCLPVEQRPAPEESVGIDLGLKDIAVTSDGERLEAGRFYRGLEDQIAQAQRRGHRRQAKRLHRKAARRRADALHKFSRRIVDQYETIVLGDVSSQKLVKTRMAKSVLDSGWSMLKRMLQYKGEHAGRFVEVVSERNTTRACSFCGALLGPKGKDGLVVRYWECSECGAEHDRDQNAARNILFVGLRKRASVRGNELWQDMIPVEPDLPVRVRYGWGACYATA